jgi:hypothetical protein
MPIASRAAAMVAGILGGSGTHVVQIIIGIVVAAALIGFPCRSSCRVRARGGGGDVRAAGRGCQPTRPPVSIARASRQCETSDARYDEMRCIQA